jgi:gamma-resorcylate decarboxylase
MDEIAPWFDSCPISDNDRQRIGRDNSFKLFNLDVKWTPKVAVPAQ